MKDSVAPELREVERAIDVAHTENELINKPFAESAWRFLAHCEDWFIVPLVSPNPSRTPRSPYEIGNLADSITTDSKWPLYWLWKAGKKGDYIPRKYDDDTYSASSQLLELSRNYTAFESAYTYASIGAIKLTLDGTTIISDSIIRDDCPYNAYDILIDGGDEDISVDVARSDRLQRVIQKRLRLKGTRFSYKLNPRLVSLAVKFAELPLGRGPSLPAEWKFSRYSVGDFQRWARVLRGLCFIHVFARIQAAHYTPAYGYEDSLIILGKNDLHKRLRKYTGLSASVVGALIEDFTYGSRGIRLPDPPLQPLIPVLPNRYVIAPHFVLNSSAERNFSVLMNRIPEERKIYSSLSSEREHLSRSRIVRALSKLRIRHWCGIVQGWGGRGEIDLALMDRSSKSCLILELKSFVAPAEVREIWDRSNEIAEGIEQVRVRKQLAASKPAPMLRALEIDQGWNISWAVASESSVGSGFVQADDVPVVRTNHLLRKIVSNNGLHGIGEWLQKREYLPVEGTHYRIVEIEPEISGWTLKWHGIEVLIDDVFI